MVRFRRVQGHYGFTPFLIFLNKLLVEKAPPALLLPCTINMSSRPNRRNDERNAVFVEQTAAKDVQDLHCQIPADLHRRVRVLAAERNTKMTAVVIEALEAYFAEQS